MKPAHVACAFVAFLAFGLLRPAAAAESVFGGGFARQCFEAAVAGRADAASIHVCDLALADPALLASDRGGTLVNRGVMRLRARDYVGAAADLDAGVRLNPGVGDGWLDRGAANLAVHRDKEGLADIQRALALGVREPEKAYYDRAIAEERLDDEKAAYFDYQRALDLKPDWDLPRNELRRFTVSEAPSP